MRCHSVGIRAASQTQLATQSTTRSIADHVRAVIRVYDTAGNVIETHEHTRAISKNRERSETKSCRAVKRDG